MISQEPRKIHKQRRPQGFETRVIRALNESMGSYEQQESVAASIAKAFISMYENGETERRINAQIGGDNIPIILNLVINKILPTKADILPYGDEKGIDNLQLRLIYNPTKTFNDNSEEYVASVISHELGHGNVFSKMVTNSGKISMDDWYYSVCEMIEKEQGVAYHIAYAMYATYFHEQQAIVSSTVSELISQLSQNDAKRFTDMNIGLKNKMFKKMVVKTEAYQTYYFILKNVCPEMNSLSDMEKATIQKKFEYYGLKHLDIVSLSKQIEIKARAALKDVCRNAMNYYYQFLCSTSKEEI